MTKDELIEWCGHNTLNCFFYNRMQPGLSATTDQAISSGRPLAVSTNETFRHIHPYIRPYPFRTLKEAIELSQPEVLQMQRAWTRENFAKQFENLLMDFKVCPNNENRQKPDKMITLRKKQPSSLVTRILSNIHSRIKKHRELRIKHQGL